MLIFKKQVNIELFYEPLLFWDETTIFLKKGTNNNENCILSNKEYVLYVFGYYQTLSIIKRNNTEFEQEIQRCCGLDVHRDTAIATVMGRGIITETRT